MGWENVFHCEWNKFGQQVLHYYWPKAICYEDITKTDFTIHRGTIDIISGGFPCQPYSSAGKRFGKEDERHLWPEMLRAIREIQPSWVVGENVRGLTNWNGGMVFDEVQADLEAEGYEVTPFLLPACAVNAPHRRDRIWFVAFKNTNENGWRSNQREEKSKEWQQWHTCSRNNERIRANDEEVRNASNTHSNGLNECNCDNEVNSSEKRINALGDINTSNGNGDVADTESKGQFGLYETRQKNNINGENTKLRGGFTRYNKENNWQQFPTVSPICNGDDGFSDRLDSITFPKWRNESIKAGGNAIVPQVVYQIFKAIEQYERTKTTN
jgi:DNA (cytosine-5)-methyltransferase 1